MADRSAFEAAADAAAGRAGVEIRVAESLRDVVAVSEILATIWAVPIDRSPGEVSALVAIRHAGGYVAGAWRGSEIVGASYGFVSLRDGRLGLHSHVTGAIETSRGVGSALKYHQRVWATSRGLEVITWTFDPLIRRNAHFNLNVLGASVVAYHENLYGSLDDGFNGSDDTDRVTVEWSMSHDRSGWTPRSSAEVASTVTLVAVPDDILRLRAEVPEEAKSWRVAHRTTLQAALATSGRVRELTTDGYYVVEAPIPT